MDFNKTPKYVMYYLFPVDSILRDKKAKVKALDRHGLCLPKNNDELVGRMLPLFRHIPPEEIVKDLIEMKLNGLACVGMDGTCLSVDEIRSKRYGELIRNCRKSRIMFIHAFPFADTYDNALTGKYPHIKQKDHQGKHPFVGWLSEEYIVLANSQPSRSFSARHPRRASEGLSAVAFASPQQPHSIIRFEGRESSPKQFPSLNLTNEKEATMAKGTLRKRR